MNMVVLFALILALGMLVDNAIVVIENIDRLYRQEGLSRLEAAKQGVGEIAVAIISSTLTTLARVVNVEEIIATAISPTPCLAASNLLSPSCLYSRSIFSITTMALSTNIPNAKIRANKTTIFIVVPIPPS